jgi:starch synthase
MSSAKRNPRVLIVTPEVTYLPDRMGSLSRYLTAKAGGLADVSAALVSALFNEGADVHVALPDYRAIFHDRLAPFLEREQRAIRNVMPDDRVHLAEDRAFFYLNRVYSAYGGENTKAVLAFQREVINNIVPRVQPDLIHCNDWMTGLIPAMARQMGIPCLFTIHNIHTVKATLAHIEDRGIDAAYFWQHLFYESSRPATNMRPGTATRWIFSPAGCSAPTSSIPSAPVSRRDRRGPPRFRGVAAAAGADQQVFCRLRYGHSQRAGSGLQPATDKDIHRNYTAVDHPAGKRENKRHLQEALGLIRDDQAPLFFWPSRLDPVQKGCQLLAEAFYGIISDYWDMNLQVVFVANGDYQQTFRDIVNHHGFHSRVAVCDFNESMEHLAYAAADFILMPSLFEPCGLPQMIAPIYGALPVAHDTGGIHDTITHLDVDRDAGNGFLFETYDAGGLYWAVTRAMAFFRMPPSQRQQAGGADHAGKCRILQPCQHGPAATSICTRRCWRDR